MKNGILRLGVTVVMVAGWACSSGAQTLTPDLKAVPEGKGWKGSLGAAKLVEKDGAPAIEFDKAGQNVVWLDGFEFHEGVIEFEARGRSAPVRGSLVGGGLC